MADTWCTHGEHHSYCIDCLEGPQPLAPQPASSDARGPRPVVRSPQLIERASGAVTSAMTLAGAVAVAEPGDDTKRGIDVEFKSADEAKYCRDLINESLATSDQAGAVSAWVWQHETSTGVALTPAGGSTGFEVRLQRRGRKQAVAE